ncbi:hypothetical protein [Streptomyces roseochromogenus]|uniref:hypothetical protein n=1 Tax=Streptomyces roseochromogenus TaxID=285450 RepID=UPI000A6D53A5|nr:hypothetical protein [Streptomyces roseochromogenus]
MHPGQIADTGLAKPLTREALRAAGALDAQGRPVRAPARQQKTVAQGAATSVWCATSRQLAGLGGVCCENCGISPLVAPEDEAGWRAEPGLPGMLPYPAGPEAVARPWEVSERLTG